MWHFLHQRQMVEDQDIVICEPTYFKKEERSGLLRIQATLNGVFSNGYKNVRDYVAIMLGVYSQPLPLPVFPVQWPGSQPIQVRAWKAYSKVPKDPAPAMNATDEGVPIMPVFTQSGKMAPFSVPAFDVHNELTLGYVIR